VSLGCHPGAVATVEATWVPLLQGTLPVPALRIHEIRYQVGSRICMGILAMPALRWLRTGCAPLASQNARGGAFTCSTALFELYAA
jgi:hypothetical protein